MRILVLFRPDVVFLQLRQQWLNGAVKDDRCAGFGRPGQDIRLAARDATRGSE
jgi:hypothetical protein